MCKPSYPFNENSNLEVLFSDDKFIVATGLDQEKKQIVAMRWTINLDKKEYADGYPYKYCENNKNQPATPIWIKIPDYMVVNFLDMLMEFNSDKNITIAETKTFDKLKEMDKFKNPTNNQINTQEKDDFTYVENELFRDKFVVIFDDNEFMVAIGVSEFDKELTMGIRWKINVQENKIDGYGYPYHNCKENELIKVWVPLPKYLYSAFFLLLNKCSNKNEIKLYDKIEKSK